MANEISFSLSVNVLNGTYKQQFVESGRLDQAAIGEAGGVVSVGTSEEDMDNGDVTTLGLLMLKNLDSTNYVTYGPKSAGAMVVFGRIKPGEIAKVRLEPGITLRWVANTAAVKIKRLLLQN